MTPYYFAPHRFTPYQIAPAYLVSHLIALNKINMHHITLHQRTHRICRILNRYSKDRTGWKGARRGKWRPSETSSVGVLLGRVMWAKVNLSDIEDEARIFLPKETSKAYMFRNFAVGRKCLLIDLLLQGWAERIVLPVTQRAYDRLFRTRWMSFGYDTALYIAKEKSLVPLISRFYETCPWNVSAISLRAVFRPIAQSPY